MLVFADGGLGIEFALVGAMAQDHQESSDGQEQAKHGDDVVNAHFQLGHQRIHTQHGQDRQVFIEVLHRNRMPGIHQIVATML